VGYELSTALAFAIPAAVIAALVCLLIHLVRNRVPYDVRLKEWAKKKEVEILAAERRLLLKGPFFGWAWEPVYRIRIRDKDGKEKIGWICFQSFFNGSGIVTEWDGIKGRLVGWR
jgi:hypothetical protein